MIDYSHILKIMRAPVDLKNKLTQKIYKEYYTQYLDFKKIYQLFPSISNVNVNLNSNVIKIGDKTQIQDTAKFIKLLKQYTPWKKGPFEIFGIVIDTEWRSDLKWDRLKNHISSLKNKKVLDVGCGSGYHCFRMKADGAKFVIGIEPYFRFVAQFYLLQKYINEPRVAVFPFRCEDMPTDVCDFDTVFSMGVLYHRMSPIEHLMKLKSFLCDGGELVLETLIVDNGLDYLMPKDRYAKMSNVWFIPSIETLKFWMEKTGFKNIRCIDINETTTEEQKATEWTQKESLIDFLDSQDSSKTIEGYPRPKRAIFIANK